MRWHTCALAFASLVLAAQEPLHTFTVEKTKPNLDFGSWDLDTKPSPNATGHLIFDTINAFLQHWPNTRYRNGHNLVPAIVPVGTVLYHGRGDNKLPTQPQWLATDPEHSYAFCRGSKEDGCWQLTVVTTRPLNLLYFDGSAAAKMNTGPMDAQDIVAWGKIVPDRTHGEQRRLEDLCEWAIPLGLDGFVRMEMDFEIMLCNFTVGVEVASFLNLKTKGRNGPGGKPPPGGPGGGGPGGPGGGPGGPPGGFPGGPGGGPGNSPDSLYSPTDPSSLADYGALMNDPSTMDSPFSEVIHSGSWHNRFPGDTRIQLDHARMVSFYDTELVPSLVPQRFEQERWYHRIAGISADDIRAVMARLERAIITPHGLGSGIDWTTLVHVIVDRYSNRLETMRYLLNTTDVDDLRMAKRVQTQLKAVIQPYNLQSAKPVANELSWASPIYEWCSTTHIKYIVASVELTQSEQLILKSIFDTNKEVCRVATRMWAQGVLAGLDDVTDAPADVTRTDDALSALLAEWRLSIQGLMSWLDWAVWITCRPACSFEEYCYLPTWPFGRGGRTGDDGTPEWEKPQPRCIRRIEPFAD